MVMRLILWGIQRRMDTRHGLYCRGICAPRHLTKFPTPIARVPKIGLLAANRRIGSTQFQTEAVPFEALQSGSLIFRDQPIADPQLFARDRVLMPLFGRCSG